MPASAQSLALQPEVLKWARERTGRTPDELADKLKVQVQEVLAWESSGRIAFNKLNRLAERTYTPIGYLVLSTPPDDHLPIADFRTRTGSHPQRPSPNLLDTIYQMQRRQAWMREELISHDEPPLEFAGEFSLDSSPMKVASAMADALKLSGGWAAVEGNWTAALRTLRDRIEAAGILVVFNGIVGNNTRRKLDVSEFQGFALVDEYAPLIFVNSADYKTAQIFTLAHELSHIFIGSSGLSKLEELGPTEHKAEVICNKIAAEFLVPGEDFRQRWKAASQSEDPYQSLARHFKVSTVVIARRAFDSELITREEFFDYYNKNQENKWGATQSGNKGRGGNFWNTQGWRVGQRFASAVIRGVKEGRLTYTEAYSLTGLKGKTFSDMSEKMGIHL